MWEISSNVVKNTWSVDYLSLILFLGRQGHRHGWVSAISSRRHTLLLPPLCDNQLSASWTLLLFPVFLFHLSSPHLPLLSLFHCMGIISWKSERKDGKQSLAKEKTCSESNTDPNTQLTSCSISFFYFTSKSRARSRGLVARRTSQDGQK